MVTLSLIHLAEIHSESSQTRVRYGLGDASALFFSRYHIHVDARSENYNRKQNTFLVLAVSC